MLLLILAFSVLIKPCVTYNNTILYAISDIMYNEKQLLPEVIYENELIDGIYIQLLWSILEPEQNSYNWSTLDSQMDAIIKANTNRTSNLLVSVSVRAGGHSPSWIYDDDKVPVYNFTISPHNGNIHCSNVSIPQPWNFNYIEYYKTLIYNLVEHLKETNTYGMITMIKCNLINQITEELRLPALDKTIEYDSCTLSNATKTWISTGYDPKLIINTWINITEYVKNLFPNSTISIEILENQAFPPINKSIDVTQEIINYGILNFDNFAVQWDALNTVSCANKVINAGKLGAIVGWQSNLFFGLTNGAGCGGDTIETSQICNQTGYEELLNYGITHMASYIEIWPVDILKFLSNSIK